MLPRKVLVATHSPASPDGSMQNPHPSRTSTQSKQDVADEQADGPIADGTEAVVAVVLAWMLLAWRPIRWKDADSTSRDTTTPQRLVNSRGLRPATTKAL